MTKIDNNTLFFENFMDADVKLIYLLDYLGEVSRFIERKKRYQKKTYKKNILNDTAIEMFTESLTSILFESVLISAWVFMEAELKDYCNAMQKAMAIDISYSDLKGSSIERFRNYVLKVLKLDMKLKDENWEDLKAISEIRHSIVHTEGNIGNKKLVHNFLKRHKMTVFDNKVLIDKKHLVFIIVLCRVFLKHIYSVALYKFPGQYKPKK